MWQYSARTQVTAQTVGNPPDFDGISVWLVVTVGDKHSTRSTDVPHEQQECVYVTVQHKIYMVNTHPSGSPPHQLTHNTSNNSRTGDTISNYALPCYSLHPYSYCIHSRQDQKTSDPPIPTWTQKMAFTWEFVRPPYELRMVNVR